MARRRPPDEGCIFALGKPNEDHIMHSRASSRHLRGAIRRCDPPCRMSNLLLVECRVARHVDGIMPLPPEAIKEDTCLRIMLPMRIVKDEDAAGIDHAACE